MREIIFRGRRADKQWAYGVPQVTNGDVYIYNHSDASNPYDWMIMVDPESVGQYTGYIDELSVKIYEGDILVALNGPPVTVVFEHGMWQLASDDPYWDGRPLDGISRTLRVVNNTTQARDYRRRNKEGDGHG